MDIIMAIILKGILARALDLQVGSKIQRANNLNNKM